ncbi:hypothetical protein WDW37_02990 [Bdellovibrionota bacterium FG-1]
MGPNNADIGELNRRLNKLMGLAKVEGLAPVDFEDLARSTLHDVAGQIEFSHKKKAA